MSLPVLLLVLGALAMTLVLLVAVLLYAGNSGGFGTQANVSDRLKTLVMAQRERKRTGEKQIRRDMKDNLALNAAATSELTRKKRSRASQLTLEKKLRYAHWLITPWQFRGIRLVFAIAMFIPAYLHLLWPLKVAFPLIGWLFVGSLLERAIDKRFKAFDKDYPVMLLSYVSLLKTGLNTIGGLEAAARGLDDGSLVRAEVELLIERLRLGLTEEQAISAFGEDIAHPELDLFVQSLLLSKKVGGQLSSTLERLARQVRKRQQFRQQAVAAVGMERSSIYAIAAIMGALMGYLSFSSPELVLPAFKHPTGLLILHIGAVLIFFGFYWSKIVTKIKI